MYFLVSKEHVPLWQIESWFIHMLAFWMSDLSLAFDIWLLSGQSQFAKCYTGLKAWMSSKLLKVCDTEHYVWVAETWSRADSGGMPHSLVSTNTITHWKYLGGAKERLRIYAGVFFGFIFLLFLSCLYIVKEGERNAFIIVKVRSRNNHNNLNPKCLTLGTFVPM